MTTPTPPARSDHAPTSLEEMIAAPLLAAARANDQLAREQLALLLGTAFRGTSDPGAPGGAPTYAPRERAFEVTRSVLEPGDGGGEPVMQEITTVVTVPVVTMLPIASLGVDAIEIDFGVDFDEEGGTPVVDSATRLDMRVETAAQPMPPGLALLVQVYNQSIHPDTAAGS